MPIDFARIAAFYRAPMMMRAKTMSEALARLGQWLDVRLHQVRAMEVATRAFPVIRFYNGAVTLWIDPSQHRLLSPDVAAPDLGESFREGGRRFLRGLRRVGDAVEEELALPRLAGTFSSMLDTILAAMERYPVPTPSMFDIRVPRSISDLFGQGALFFRAFTSSLDQVNSFASEGHQLYQSLGSSSGSGAESAPTDWPALMAEGIRWITGAALLIPIASMLLVSTLRSAILILKTELVRQFQLIEAEIFALRRDVIDFFYTTLGGFGPLAFDFLLATQLVVMQNVDYYFRFAALYMRNLLWGVRFFAEQLSEFLRFFTVIIEAVRSTLEAILNFDLMPIFLAALGIPPLLMRALPSPPRLTIDDLISMWLGLGVVVAREALNAFLFAIEHSPAMYTLGLFTSIQERVRALRRLLNITLTARPFTPETAMSLPLAGFPDIYAAFFGAGAPNFAAALSNASAQLQSDINGLFTSGRDFLLATSRAFSRAAGQAARLGSPAQYALMTERAEQLSSSVMSPVSDELRARMAERSDVLANSFDRFVAGGAFDVIGAALPLYVEQMSRYWTEQTEAQVSRVNPTSPHILARRAGLRRVRFPRLLIHAPGRALDADLIARVAERFKGAIENAYVTGLAQAERTPGG